MNPNPIPEPSKFTTEIMVRTVIGGAAVGEVIARIFGLSRDYAPLIGGVVGAIYDVVLFWWKSRPKTPKENAE